MIALAAVVLQAVVASGFSPPLETPLRVTSESIRRERGVTRRVISAKRIVFHRAPGGYLAELTVEPQKPGDDADHAAIAFANGIAQLAGRKLVFELDVRGRVTAMRDQAGAYAAILRAVRSLTPTGRDPGSVASAKRIAALLGALERLPPDRQFAMLASMVASPIAADIVAEGAGPPRAVRVPAASPYGTMQLDGLRAVREAGGALEVSVSAVGEARIDGAGGAATGELTLDTLRRADPLPKIPPERPDEIELVVPVEFLLR